MRQQTHDPGAELAPNGRDSRGRFARGNGDSRTHGAFSEQRALMLAPVRQELRADILAGLGFTDDEPPSRPMSMLIDQLVEARLIAQSYFEFLAASGGPITSKGRQRRAVDGYLRAADRVAKFASMIGLERRSRKAIESPREWLERLHAEQHGDDLHDDAEAGAAASVET